MAKAKTESESKDSKAALKPSASTSSNASNGKAGSFIIEPEFEEITGMAVVPYMTIATHAPTKSGKTWFGLSAPGPIGVLSMDTNCRTICEKYKRENPDKKIIYREFIRNPLSQIDDINELKRHWKEVREAYFRIIDNKAVRSIIVDTGSQAWEDCKLAYVGRQKVDVSSEVDDQGKATGTRISTAKTIPRDLGEPKREVREMIAAAEGKNLILLHRSKALYINDSNTGRLTLDGMPGVEYLANVSMEQFRDPITGTFVARLNSSTVNSELRGREGKVEYPNGIPKWVATSDELTDSDITFQMVGITVYPDSSFEDWE